MIIDQVRIVNCNRFALGGRKDITIRPRARIQMVLGTNGSGKSSFKDLCLSPLSPSPTDFDEGGYWEFKCSYQGSTYLLSANYDRKEYKFFKDDSENLNPGGLITAQDVLVEQHLGYTRDIHRLLTLDRRLTQMSPRERGDVISTISREDLGYAYSKFREWTKELNAKRSIQKFLLGRIAEEETKLMPEEVLGQIRENITKIRGELTELMSLPRVEYDERISRNTLDGSYLIFNMACDRFLKIEPLNLQGHESGHAIQQHADELAGSIATMTDDLKALSELASTTDARLRELEGVASTDVDEVVAEIEQLESTLTNIPNKSIDVPDELLTNAEDLISELTGILSNVVGDLKGSADHFLTLARKSDEITQQLNNASHSLHAIQSRISDLHSVSTINCPNCQHAFQPGVNVEELQLLTQRSERGTEYISKLELELEGLQEELRPAAETNRAMLALESIRTQSYQQHRGLYMLIDSLGGFAVGRELLPAFELYTREVVNSTRRRHLQERLTLVKSVLASHSTSSVELEQVRLESQRLESEYTTRFHTLENLRSLRQSTIHQSEQLRDYTKAYEACVNAYTLIRENVMDLLRKEYTEIVLDEINRRQSSLALNEQALTANDTVETHVKDLNVQLERTVLDVDAYRAMVNAINPRTGLIAERMHAQIGSKVEGINTIIRKIWNYDFTVELPDMSDGNLNYRFPITVAGRRRADIRNGSGSMQDIVDTAFAILTHHSLGLKGYPIYLDEFDSPFDGVHTSNMVKMVKDLADSGQYGYVVVISHDEGIQHSFPGAEILVLDDRNLDGHHEVNSHVTFR